jgi:hypothetical protein
MTTNWQPIDEKTPRDRRILLWRPKFGAVIGSWHYADLWSDEVGRLFLNAPPTHWRQLPAGPEEGKDET